MEVEKITEKEVKQFEDSLPKEETIKINVPKARVWQFLTIILAISLAFVIFNDNDKDITGFAVQETSSLRCA